MVANQRIVRKACIAIAILGIAFVAAPVATAICVGPQPVWWPNGNCYEIHPIPGPNTHVCVSNNINDCLP